MKLIVFSDSHHRRIVDMLSIIDEEKPDAVLHLGDLTEDAFDIRSVYPDLPVYGVRGNNDWGSDEEDDRIVCAEQVRVFMTHGHLYGVRRGTKALEQRARQNHCSVALYGHTHEAEITRERDMLIANPGSIGLPFGAPPSYLRLTVEGEHISPELVYLNRDS